MNQPVLILTAAQDQEEKWLSLLREAHVPVRTAANWGDAQPLMALHQASVVLFDADFAMTSTDEVLTLGHQVGVPVIVVARNFDASRWLSLFEQGAYDVLRRPVLPEDLCVSVATAWRGTHGRALRAERNWWESLVSWVRGKEGW